MAFTEQTLELDNAHISNLFGQFDCYLKKLERAFGTQIIDRDGTVHIRGEQSAVAHTAAVFTELQELARRGNQIQEQNVDYAIAMHMENQENTLLEIDGDLICHTVSGKPVKPKTLGQKQYVDAIREKMIVFGLGRIILTRPAIEAGEKLGFLPGDLQSKVDPYLRPLYDALYQIMGAESFQRNMEKGLIEVAPLAYMRGRTLDNAYIILDEAQNTTPAQMKMFLTRIGFGSKVVITGDASQKDLAPGTQSGLDVAVKVLSGLDDIGFCNLTSRDVVRHPLVQKIVKAYETYEAKQAYRESKERRLTSAAAGKTTGKTKRRTEAPLRRNEKERRS